MDYLAVAEVDTASVYELVAVDPASTDFYSRSVNWLDTCRCDDQYQKLTRRWPLEPLLSAPLVSSLVPLKFCACV